MTTLTVRNIDVRLKAKLRIRAARHGRSMEAEVRAILQDVLAEPVTPDNLADLAQSLFGPEGIDLEVPPREPAREPPDFGV